MRFVVDQVGKRVIVFIVGGDRLADLGHRRLFVKTRIAQISHFELGFVFLQLFRLRLDFPRRWSEARMQLASQVTNFVLTLRGRGELVDVP
ncbi:hypothetical protein D3C80_1131050 [compost metagenome]